MRTNDVYEITEADLAEVFRLIVDIVHADETGLTPSQIGLVGSKLYDQMRESARNSDGPNFWDDPQRWIEIGDYNHIPRTLEELFPGLEYCG